MFTAADLIDALHRRSRLRLRRGAERPPGEFPPGWATWFASLAERPGRVVGALAQDIVDVLAQRPLARPPRADQALTRWQAFNALWRQQWHPPAPDERRLRRVAVALTAAWHLALALLLVWLLIFQYLGMPPEPASAGEQVVRVEYIGRGAREGGGGPQAARAAPSPARQPEAGRERTPEATATPMPQARIEAPAVDAPVPDIPQRDVPEPQIPPAEAEQPVTVSEPTPSAPTVFTLPPTRRRPEPVRTPELAAPDVPLRAAEVAEPVQPVRRTPPQPELGAPELRAREPQIAEREVPAPLPQLPARTMPQPVVRAPDLQARTPELRAREVPAPARGVASAAPAPAAPGTGASPSPARAQGREAGASATPAPATGPGTARPTADNGSGDRRAPPGGTTAGPRADDWGDSTRNRPGGRPGQGGLYDDQGRVRLADAPGSSSARPPPGAVEEIRDLDRAGTWLKRKPTDYEPTAFDRYWVPHETLLAEWVRRGVQTVSIPIPGTSRKIVCVVSVLQLGGGCGLRNPNANEQPATARPPPDIPFKPHLQEDNGSVRPGRPPGG